MEINIRHTVESDFPELVYLFKEFADFERLPEMMMNSTEINVVEQNCYLLLD